MKETMTGVIMAGDNVLALFLLPIFGALSDKVDTKIGKRMPFILGGTALAVILLMIFRLITHQKANPTGSIRTSWNRTKTELYTIAHILT